MHRMFSVAVFQIRTSHWIYSFVQSEATPKKFLAFLRSVGRASSRKGLWRLASMQFRMLADRFGFQDETSVRYNFLLQTQSFKHGIVAVSCGAQSHLTQNETSLITVERQKYKVPFADGLNGGFGHDGTGHAGSGEFHIDIHFDPQSLAGIRDLDARLRCPRRGVHLRLNVGDAALPDATGVSWSRDVCLGADTDGRKVFFVDARHNPDRREVGNREEFLRCVDYQTEIGVAREDDAVDWGRYNQIGIDLFGLLERRNLTVTGSEQLQFFESRAHMRFMSGMRRGNFLLLLLARGSQLYEVPRPHQLLVLCLKL